MVLRGIGARPLRFGFAAFFAASLVACSNSQPAPQGRAVTYGQPSTAYRPTPPPPTYAPYVATAPQPMPAAPRTANAPVSATPSYTPPAPSGPAGAWQWHSRIADAQADARAQGKLILIASTKPGCGLCEKFRHRIVPEVQSEVSDIAVGYVYDITRPESGRVDQVLRGNLPGASLMPLVGFVTSDLQWVSGFYGQTDANQFRGVIARARAVHPMRHAQVPAAGNGPSYAMLNEYGEYEWSPLGAVTPEDAIGPQEPAAALAAAPTTAYVPTGYSMSPTGVWCRTPTGVAVPPPPPPPAWSPERDVATLVRTPVAPVVAADAIAAATEPPAPAPEMPPALTEPAPVVTETPVVAATPAPTPAPRPSAPAELPAWLRDPNAAVAASMHVPAPAVEDKQPAPPTAPEAVDAWAETMLAGALEKMRAGQYDEARMALTQVIARTDPESALGVEAARGTVAIYNRKRIEKAPASDRQRLSEQARRDLGTSRWASLFD